jgi:hypothetical protein
MWAHHQPARSSPPNDNARDTTTETRPKNGEDNRKKKTHTPPRDTVCAGAADALLVQGRALVLLRQRRRVIGYGRFQFGGGQTSRWAQQRLAAGDAGGRGDSGPGRRAEESMDGMTAFAAAPDRVLAMARGCTVRLALSLRWRERDGAPPLIGGGVPICHFPRSSRFPCVPQDETRLRSESCYPPPLSIRASECYCRSVPSSQESAHAFNLPCLLVGLVGILQLVSPPAGAPGMPGKWFTLCSSCHLFLGPLSCRNASTRRVLSAFACLGSRTVQLPPGVPRMPGNRFIFWAECP